jgi:GNAT superfamily N-acetyltransferase
MADRKDQGEGRRSRLPAHAERCRRPDGKLEMVITHLEMRKRPSRLVRHLPRGLAIIRARNPTVSFYRYLYHAVGAPWLWYERRQLDDEALRVIIQDPRIEIDVLYVEGVPAGYVELDFRVDGEVELAYFGLMLEFIGRGLGRYLLDWGLGNAWNKQPQRVWVHSCNFDHPKAIAVYQRAGFVPYRQETRIIDVPQIENDWT